MLACTPLPYSLFCALVCARDLVDTLYVIVMDSVMQQGSLGKLALTDRFSSTTRVCRVLPSVLTGRVGVLHLSKPECKMLINSNHSLFPAGREKVNCRPEGEVDRVVDKSAATKEAVSIKSATESASWSEQPFDVVSLMRETASVHYELLPWSRL